MEHGQHVWPPPHHLPCPSPRLVALLQHFYFSTIHTLPLTRLPLPVCSPLAVAPDRHGVPANPATLFQHAIPSPLLRPLPCQDHACLERFDPDPHPPQLPPRSLLLPRVLATPSMTYSTDKRHPDLHSSPEKPHPTTLGLPITHGPNTYF